MGLFGKKVVDRSVSSSGHSADGRKTSHRFFRNKDDDISDRQVLKNELEESRNSGGIFGGIVGGTFGDQIYFLFFGYKVLVL